MPPPPARFWRLPTTDVAADCASSWSAFRCAGLRSHVGEACSFIYDRAQRETLIDPHADCR